MRELREDVLHPVCAIHGQVLMSRMQGKIGSRKKRKGVWGSKRILGDEEKGSAGLLIPSLGTACSQYKRL